MSVNTKFYATVQCNDIFWDYFFLTASPPASLVTQK